MFHILGNRETVLHSCNSQTAARQFITGYTKCGNWGGYEFITIEFYGAEENTIIETFDNPAFE